METNLTVSNLDEKFKPYQENLSRTWQNVLKLWIEIGFSEEQIFNRTTMIVDALNEVVTDINEGEHKLRADIEKSLIEYKQKVELLQMQLRVNDVELNDQDGAAKDEKRLTTNATLLEECRYYKQLYARLVDIKKERKSRYERLMRRQDELCNLLNERPYEFTSERPDVNLDDLDNLEHHVHELSLEKRERVSELRQIGAEMMCILEKYQLSLATNSSLNQLRTHFDDQQPLQDLQEVYMGVDKINTFRLSLDKLKSRSEQLVEDIELVREEIRSNWTKYELTNPELEFLVNSNSALVEYNQVTLDRLVAENKRCQSVKMSKISAFIEKLRDQIEHMWNELCFVEQDKLDFIHYMSKEITVDEDLFKRHEIYLEELSETYARSIDLTRKIKLWDATWQEYTQFEIEYSDPNRFKQKHYRPLVENKLRTKLTTELSKLEKEITSECDVYLKNEGKTFRFYGVEFAAHAAAKRAEFERWRQECRLQRQAKIDSTKKHYMRPTSVVTGTTKRSSLSTPNNKNSQQKQAPTGVATKKRPAAVTAATTAAAKSSTASPLRRIILGRPHTMKSSPSPKPTTISTAANAAVATVKRRSIKSLHEALKRRSRGHTPSGTNTSRGNNSSLNASARSRPSRPHRSHNLAAAAAVVGINAGAAIAKNAAAAKAAKSAPPPIIRVVNPHGHLVHTYSPQRPMSVRMSSTPMSANGELVTKRARLDDRNVCAGRNNKNNNINNDTLSSPSSDDADSALFSSNLNTSQSPPQFNSTSIN